MIKRKNRGMGILAVSVMAAALSGLVAFTSSKTVWTHFGSVSSSLEKMTAQNYVFNRAEIIKASSYADVVSGGRKLDNGFYEELDVSEAMEDDLLVKTAKVKVYSDSSKKRLISSMVIKRTNPTAGLADRYIPEGTEGTTYNSAAVNNFFAKVNKDDDKATVGSVVHPVFVDEGHMSEIDLGNSNPSLSRTVLTINDDGSLGVLKANDFFGQSSTCYLTVGNQGVDTDIFVRLRGAELVQNPSLGQMIIALNDNNDRRKGLGIMTSHAHNSIRLVDSFGVADVSHWVRSDFGASRYTMTNDLRAAFGWDVSHYAYPDTPRAPFFAIFGEAYDNNGTGVPRDAWLLVGTLLRDSAPPLLVNKMCDVSEDQNKREEEEKKKKEEFYKKFWETIFQHWKK